MACIGPGPFAGMLLADMGADVVRVDRPDRAGGRRSDAESHLVLDPGAAPGGGPPVPPLNMLGDFGGRGMLLALGVVGALLHARPSRPGPVVHPAILARTAPPP